MAKSPPAKPSDAHGALNGLTSSPVDAMNLVNIPMTIIYTPLAQDGYEFCHPVDPKDFETINILINGTERARDWKPLAMHIVNKDHGRDLIESDSPWLEANALLLSNRAAEALRPMLLEYGELLPVLCQRPGLSLYNPTRLVDALDEKASSVLRFSSGKIMSVRQYVFREEVVRDIDVFKIPNLRVSPTFFSQRFVDSWRAADLTGLDFKN